MAYSVHIRLTFALEEQREKCRKSPANGVTKARRESAGLSSVEVIPLSLHASADSSLIANVAIHLLIVALRRRVPVKLVPILREESQRNAEAERIHRDGSQSPLCMRGCCVTREHHRQVSGNSYRSESLATPAFSWKRNSFTHLESSEARSSTARLPAATVGNRSDSRGSDSLVALFSLDPFLASHLCRRLALA